MTSGKADVEARVTEVLQLKLDGYTPAQIKGLTKHWNVTERTLNNYLSRATEKLTEINKITAEETRSNLLTNLWDLFRINKNKSDIKEMHRVLNSIGKFAGLDKINVQMSGDTERILKDLPAEELHKLVASDDKGDDETNS